MGLEPAKILFDREGSNGFFGFEDGQLPKLGGAKVLWCTIHDVIACLERGRERPVSPTVPRVPFEILRRDVHQPHDFPDIRGVPFRFATFWGPRSCEVAS